MVGLFLEVFLSSVPVGFTGQLRVSCPSVQTEGRRQQQCRYDPPFHVRVSCSRFACPMRRVRPEIRSNCSSTWRRGQRLPSSAQDQRAPSSTIRGIITRASTAISTRTTRASITVRPASRTILRNMGRRTSFIPLWLCLHYSLPNLRRQVAENVCYNGRRYARTK
ncbi:MAG: hypothetical protein ACD_75C00917G0001 [uncultured bacterium]|nr:MAG: hypothetical protein ACD_75C00917G0001 [uncultured bacterium]